MYVCIYCSVGKIPEFIPQNHHFYKYVRGLEYVLTTLALVIEEKQQQKPPDWRLDKWLHQQSTSCTSMLTYLQILSTSTKLLQQCLSVPPALKVERWRCRGLLELIDWVISGPPMTRIQTMRDGEWGKHKILTSDLIVVYIHMYIFTDETTHRDVHTCTHIYELRHMKNEIVTQGWKVTLVKVPQVYESSIQN